MTVSVRRLAVAELGSSIVQIPRNVALALRDARICAVQPTHDPDRWALSSFTRVGTFVRDGVALEIVPKASVESIVHMVSRAGHQMPLSQHEHTKSGDRALSSALARALADQLGAIAARGLLRGYRTIDETGSVVRGRWDVPRQINRRPGMSLPLELTVDDFTPDISENQLLAGAAAIARRFDRLPETTRAALEAVEPAFSGVEPLRTASRLPHVVLDRRNAHYAPALAIAAWILTASAWSQRSGAQAANAFLVDMAAIFEDFVAEELRLALRQDGFELGTQETQWRLDREGNVRLRPDLVVRRRGRVVAIADTKYKILPGGLAAVPNDDVYQALAYATALGAPRADLIYVGANASARRMQVRGAAVSVGVHELPLTGSPADLQASITGLAARLVAGLLAEDTPDY